MPIYVFSFTIKQPQYPQSYFEKVQKSPANVTRTIDDLVGMAR